VVLAGGALDVESSPQGTTVRASFPAAAWVEADAPVESENLDAPPDITLGSVENLKKFITPEMLASSQKTKGGNDNF
jgi:hypothetical protein